jgi:threonine/homoserine/homoserine lactone efflux protein
MLSILFKWIIIWFSIAAPVGPIWMLCINRTLKWWKINWLAVGFWAATADAMYWLIAAFWLTIISDFLLNYEKFIKIFWSIFLIYLAYTIFVSKVEKTIKIWKHKWIAKEYFYSFLLTISNPITILSFLAIFSSLNWLSSSFIIVLWVFLWSILWWLILVFFTSFIHQKISKNILKNINVLSWIILLLFAFYSIYSVLFE